MTNIETKTVDELVKDLVDDQQIKESDDKQLVVEKETKESDDKQLVVEKETKESENVRSIDKNESLLTLSSTDEHNKWSPTHFNKNQLNIIRYVLMNSQLHIPYFVPFDWTKDVKEKIVDERKKSNVAEAATAEAKFLRQTYLYGLNELSYQLHRTYINANYTVSKTIRYIDLGVLVNMLLDEGRHLFTNNQHRAILHQLLYSQRTLTKEDESELSKGFVHMNDLDYVLSKIRNLPVSFKPKNPDELEAFNARTMFASYAAYRILHTICTTYIKSNYQVGLQNHISYKVNDKFKIVQIPKELQLKFNKAYKYFDELKKILKYNEQQGFYTYTQDGIELPILCIHEYMILSGKPLSEVSIKCYLDGACKYCGAEMNAYHEVAKQELPVKVYDLIYKFMSCLNENVDESLMMFAIFDLIYNSVRKNVDSANPNNYDESVVAFSGLYLYALYLNTKEQVGYSPTKFNKFLDSAKKYWTEIGWTTRNIEQAVNSSIFDEMKQNNNAANILKQFIYTNAITFLDVLPLSILFNDDVDPADVSKLKATNKIQELFLSNKMGQFNDAIQRSINSLWKLISNKQVIDNYKPVKYSSSITNIEVVKTNNGERFFKECCGVFCPVNGAHEWSGNSCKHCKLNKDKSNYKQVYESNADAINNSYLQEPRVLASKKLLIQPLYTVKEIELMKPEELYEKWIKIDSYVLKQAIDKAINDLSNFDELKQLLKTLLCLNANEIKKDVNFIKQCLCFIVSNGIRTSPSLISELENIYFKIDNIEWLTI